MEPAPSLESLLSPQVDELEAERLRAEEERIREAEENEKARKEEKRLKRAAEEQKRATLFAAARKGEFDTVSAWEMEGRVGKEKGL